MGRNEDGLLRKAVYDYQDSSETIGGGKLFDEIHGDGIPRLFRDW